MLGKVLKYDMKSMGKPLIPMYLLTLCLAILSRVVGMIASKITIIEFVSVLINVTFVIALIVSLAYTCFVTIQKYYLNLFRDEGYLTHTLPLKKSTLINSKLITGFVYFIISVAVILISLMIAFYTKGALSSVWSQIPIALNRFGISVPAFLTFMIVFIMIAYFGKMLLVYASISLGHTANSNKITYSILVGIIIYFISNILNVIGLVIIYLLDPNILNSVTQSLPPVHLITSVFVSAGICEMIMIISCYIAIMYSQKCKLNLE